MKNKILFDLLFHAILLPASIGVTVSYLLNNGNWIFAVIWTAIFVLNVIKIRMDNKNE